MRALRGSSTNAPALAYLSVENPKPLMSTGSNDNVGSSQKQSEAPSC